MLPAIIGLIGVLIGAIASTGTTYWIESRKEQAEERKAKISHDKELTRAARMIADELAVGLNGAKWLVEKKRWAPPEEKFPLDAWQREKAILAVELSYDDWRAVWIAAKAVDDFRGFHSRSSEVVSDAIAETGKPVVRDIEAGLKVLGLYVGGTPPTR